LNHLSEGDRQRLADHELALQRLRAAWAKLLERLAAVEGAVSATETLAKDMVSAGSSLESKIVEMEHRMAARIALLGFDKKGDGASNE